MKYMFFDTAVNGYYTLSLLQKEFPGFKPLIPAEEKISDDAAPFIFETDDTKFANFSRKSNIALEKILLLESAETIEAIQQYYGRFVVQNIKGKPFYFRFWAADIFKKYTKTCDAKQLKEFFGPVQKFICIDEDPAYLLSFSFNGTRLVTDRVAADNTVPAGNEAKATGDFPPVKNDHAESHQTPPPQEKRPPRRFIY